MKRHKIIAAGLCGLTAAAVLLASGCSLGGKSSDVGKGGKETKMVNTHVTYIEGNSEKQTETGTNTDTKTSKTSKKTEPSAEKDEPLQLEIPDTAEYLADFLSADEKLVFSQLYSGLADFETDIDIKNSVIYKDDIGAFISMLTAACPYIDYIGSEYTICMDAEGYVSAIEVTYDRSREQAEQETAAVEQRIAEIIAGVENGWTDYDKALYFHDSIILNCQYDNGADNPYSAYGCLIEGRAVCEGYAKAMQLLCTRAGLKCLPVAGKAYDGGTVQPHLWNKVRLDGEWVNIDLTWDDPVTDAGEDYIRYDYFGLTDAECAKDHTVDENKYVNYPEAFSSAANYYRRTGLYAESGDDIFSLMCSSVEKAMGEKGVARLKCADEDVYNEAVEELFGGDGTVIFDVLKEAYSRQGGDWSTGSYAVIKNAELYTITVMLYKNE